MRQTPVGISAIEASASDGARLRADASERKPRGVVLTNLYATPAEPGRATFNQQQFRALSALHDLVIGVSLPARLPCRAHLRKAPSERNAPRTVHFDVWEPPIIGRLLNATTVGRAARKALADDLAASRPDYVLGSFAYPDGVAAVSLARQLGVPAFVKVHGTDVNTMAESWGTGRQIRWALRHAAGVVVVSRALADKVEPLGGRRADTLLLYNGVDRSLFRPRERLGAREDLGLDPHRRAVLYVGNLKRAKGVIDLVAAFVRIAAERPEVDLEILGTGPARAEIEELRRGHGLERRIHLRGSRPHDEIATWIAGCDLLALPSHAEGVPNVVLEALAAGRPIVATRVGGIPEVVGDTAGRLVPCRDIGALAAALDDVLLRSWSAAALSQGVPAAAWSDNASRLAAFIEARCARRASHGGR
jgi:glycosyltransferase involved in cell wall biosynthesis